MMVALHGFTGSPAQWASFDCTALTIAGHGEGAPTTDKGNGFAIEVERLASAMPTSHVHLVGYSLGARLALAIALKYPNRLAKLTLIGVHPGLDQAQRSARQHDDKAWASLLRTDGITAFVDKWERMPLWQSQSETQLEQQRKQRLAHDPRALAAALTQLSTGSMPDMRPKLATLRVPTRLVVGALDTKFQALASDMLHVLPHAEMRVIKGAGHNPLIEQPQAMKELLQ